MGTSGSIYFVSDHLNSNGVIISKMETASDTMEWSYLLRSKLFKTMFVNSKETFLYMAFAEERDNDYLYIIQLDIANINRYEISFIYVSSSFCYSNS